MKKRILSITLVFFMTTMTTTRTAAILETADAASHHVRSRKRQLSQQQQQQQYQPLPPPPRMKESVEQMLVANGWISSSSSSTSAASRSLLSSTKTSGFWNGGGSNKDEDKDEALSCESYYEEYQLNLRNEMDGIPTLDAIRHGQAVFQPRDTSIVLLDHYRAGLLPFVYKIFIDKGQNGGDGDGQAAHGEYFGPNGEYTTEFQLRYPQMEAFWENVMNRRNNNHGENAAPSPTVVLTNQTILLGAHGSILQNATTLRQSLEFLFVFDENDDNNESSSSSASTSTNTVDQAVVLIQDLIETHVPGGYNNPLLTLNAFAHNANPKYGTYDTVVVGDGALQAIAQANVVLNIASTSSSTRSSGHYDESHDDWTSLLHQANFVLAHEFAHQLQFLAGIRPDNVVVVADAASTAGNNIENATTSLAGPMTTTTLTTDTTTTTTQQQDAPLRNANYELLADALASYFLAHPQGARFNVSWIESWVAVAFAFGGCNATKETFHGTPRQRSCVATWGARLALSSNDSMSFDDLVNQYRQDLPQLLALDASVCGFQDKMDPGGENEMTSTAAAAENGHDDDAWEMSNAYDNGFYPEHTAPPPETTVSEQDGEEEIVVVTGQSSPDNNEVSPPPVQSDEENDETVTMDQNIAIVDEPLPSLSTSDTATSASTTTTRRWDVWSWIAIAMIWLW